MQRLDTNSPDFQHTLEKTIRERGGNPSNPSVATNVNTILNAIQEQGDEALLSYAKQWDGVPQSATAAELEVTPAEIDAAWHAASNETIDALTLAADRIRAFHVKQREESWTIQSDDGTFLSHRVIPLNTVGIYVPGGTAAYPSSVLMNAIPAQVAGVSNVIMATPSPQGPIAGAVLVAARIAEVSRVFRVGGAQAIGAMAYGTSTIPRVDKIVGPGNVWVAAAKRQVFGTVDIDMIAGPSEICILATRNGGASAEVLAADLLSQAEHDTQAMAPLNGKFRHCHDRLSPKSPLTMSVWRSQRGIWKMPFES